MNYHQAQQFSHFQDDNTVLYIASVTSKYYLLNLLAQYNACRKTQKDPFYYFILCMDDVTYKILSKLSLDYVVLIPLSEWEDHQLRTAKQDRTLAEYCWTVKPPFLSWLLETQNIPSITFLDADLFPFSALESIRNQILDSAVILYPHNFPPHFDHLNAQAGRFNAGMISFRNGSHGLDAVRWWTERVIEWCYHRDEDGKLGDQKYLLEFPHRFPGTAVNHDRTINIGPWSVSGYRVEAKDGVVLVDGRPLTLFHFHQFRLNPDLSFVPASACYPMEEIVLKAVYEPYHRSILEALDFVRQVEPAFEPPIP